MHRKKGQVSLGEKCPCPLRHGRRTQQDCSLLLCCPSMNGAEKFCSTPQKYCHLYAAGSFAFSRCIEMNCGSVFSSVAVTGLPKERNRPLLNVCSLGLLDSETWKGNAVRNTELEGKCESSRRKPGDRGCLLPGGPFGSAK